MSLDDYVPQKISVIFKPEATPPQMYALLFSYVHEKVFPEHSFDNPFADQSLARIYVIEVEAGREGATLRDIQRQYDDILQSAYRPPVRRVQR
ncbi:hypothetical protein HYT55_05910 [Candidatus Woesearchaeota archaeon]|nr:hypothetical protein [Candidatus Woesearchaeota archaeon]